MGQCFDVMTTHIWAVPLLDV